MHKTESRPLPTQVAKFSAGMRVVAIRNIYSGAGPHNRTPQLRVLARERGVVAPREPDYGNRSLVPVWFGDNDKRMFTNPSDIRPTAHNESEES